MAGWIEPRVPKSSQTPVPAEEQPKYSRKMFAFVERTGVGGCDNYVSCDFDWRGQYWDHYLLPTASNDAYMWSDDAQWKRRVYWRAEGIPLSALTKDQFLKLSYPWSKDWSLDPFALSMSMVSPQTAVAEAKSMCPEAWSFSLHYFLDHDIPTSWGDGGDKPIWSPFDFDCHDLFLFRKVYFEDKKKAIVWRYAKHIHETAKSEAVPEPTILVNGGVWDAWACD